VQSLSKLALTLEAVDQLRTVGLVQDQDELSRSATAGLHPQVLTPTLRPADLVILDNLSSHKGARVAECVQRAQAELIYLPPYSPDLNPIEMAFSKIKQALRSLKRRTVDELWKCMQSVLDQITPSDAAGFFQHCKYPLQIK
jgi:transposase